MQGCFGLQPSPTAAADLRGHSLAELPPRELGNISMGQEILQEQARKELMHCSFPKRGVLPSPRTHSHPDSTQHKISQLLRHEGALKCSDL